MTLIAKQIDQFTSNNIEHAFLTRHGGVSAGLYDALNFGSTNGDSVENVEQNVAILAKHYGLPKHHVKHVKQVHSADVLEASDYDVDLSNEDADALVTNKPTIGILIKTADCCPILFKDPYNKVIGGAHAGWRGAIGGVIGNTIKKMLEMGADISHIEAAIGPTIAQNSYEVDDAFYNQFIAQDLLNKAYFINSVNDKKYMFNLPAYCSAELKKHGVKSAHNIAIDTYQNENEFFSCRRAFHKGQKGFGIQGSLIMML